MLATFLTGLSLGLATAPACLGTCAPLAFAVVADTPPERWRTGIRNLFLFLLGRAGGYLAFGAAAGALAETITPSSLRVPMGIAFVALAAALWLGAAGRRAPEASWFCRFAHGPGRLARSPLLLGLLSGLQICPPLLAAVALAVQAGGAGPGAATFAGFFLGTSAGLVPFAAWPWIGRRLPAGWLDRLRATLPLLVGFFFFCWGMDRLFPERVVTVPVTEADLREVLPGAGAFVAVPSPPRFDAFKTPGDTVPLGACFVTSQAAPAASRGYGGPLPALVGIDASGTITGVKLLPHRETPAYVARLEDPAYLARFRGRKVTEPLRPGEDVDAVTAATVSAGALCAGIREGGRKVAAERFGVAAPEAPPPPSWEPVLKSKRFWLLAVFLLAGSLAARRWPAGPAHTAVLGASIVVLGLALMQFFSIEHVVKIAAGEWPALPASLGWYVLVAGVLLITLLRGRLYCASLCPFGALTDLMGRAWPWPVPVPARVSRLLRPVRFLLLVGTPAAWFVWRRLTVVDYEPFTPAFAALSGRGGPADAAGIALLALIGVLCLASRRFWCRHLCPAGAALEITAKLQFRRDDEQKPEAWLDV